MILIFICLLLTFKSTLGLVANRLNVKAHRYTDEVKLEFSDQYSLEKHEKAHAYLRENSRLQVVSEFIKWSTSIAALLLGFYGWVSNSVKEFVQNSTLIHGLVFFLVMGICQWLVSTPFSLYQTFSIEERFGFNKTSIKTYFTDQLKGAILGLLLGGLILGSLLWVLERTGDSAWLIAWALLMVLQVLILFIAPVWIFPLFNKYTPIAEGEIKNEMQNYASRIGFSLQGVFQIDASKRSTKANAFFTGFGRYRRFVMFDTLMTQFSVRELLAVFAHEAGHFKKKHIVKSVALSSITSLILFYGVGQVFSSPKWYVAFGFRDQTAALGLFIAVLVFGPIADLFSFLTTALSRKFEFEADEFSVTTQKDPSALISALKKMSVDHLSHLTPHPLKVAMDYSHPPILERIRALKKLESQLH